MDHVLVERALDEAALEQELDAVDEARVVGCAELHRIAERDRADRAGVEPAVGRGWHRRPAEAFLAAGQAALDRRREVVGGAGEFEAVGGVAVGE